MRSSDLLLMALYAVVMLAIGRPLSVASRNRFAPDLATAG